MSKSSASNLADEARNKFEKYSGVYTLRFKQLDSDIVYNWYDDVGKQAAAAIRNVGSRWYDAVKSGFYGVADLAREIAEAYSVLDSVGATAERAISNLK